MTELERTDPSPFPAPESFRTLSGHFYLQHPDSTNALNETSRAKVTQIRMTNPIQSLEQKGPQKKFQSVSSNSNAVRSNCPQATKMEEKDSLKKATALSSSERSPAFPGNGGTGW